MVVFYHIWLCRSAYSVITVEGGTKMSVVEIVVAPVGTIAVYADPNSRKARRIRVYPADVLLYGRFKNGEVWPLIDGGKQGMIPAYESPGYLGVLPPDADFEDESERFEEDAMDKARQFGRAYVFGEDGADDDGDEETEDFDEESSEYEEAEELEDDGEESEELEDDGDDDDGGRAKTVRSGGYR